MLGQSIEKQKFFYGELSMVTLVSPALAEQEITRQYNNCGEALLNGEDSTGKTSSAVVR